MNHKGVVLIKSKVNRMAEKIESIEIVRAKDLPLKIRTATGISKGFAEIRVSSSSSRKIQIRKIEGKLSTAFKQLLIKSGNLNKMIFPE